MSSRSRDDGGIVAVWVAVAMVAIFGFTAMVVDLGQVYVTRAELQNAADAAATSAAASLPPPDDPSPDFGPSCAAAVDLAHQNHDGNSEPIIGCGDLVYGTYDDFDDDDPSTGQFTAGGSPVNAVEATTHRTGADQVEMIFAPVLGIDEVAQTRRAVGYRASVSIDFESGLSPGDTPTSVSVGSGISGDDVPGSVTIDAARRTNPGAKDAMIFDAECDGAASVAQARVRCTGRYNPGQPTTPDAIGDYDLWADGQGNILIIDERPDPDDDDTLPDPPDRDPDDNGSGGTVILDFSGFGEGRVTVDSMKIIDGDSDSITVRLYSGGALIDTQTVTGAPDGGLVTRFLDPVPGIDRMEITLTGSGGIDDIGASSYISLVG